MELTKQEKRLLLDILDSIRIDAILEQNNMNHDEIGLIMAKLGDKMMKKLYIKKEGN